MSRRLVILLHGVGSNGADLMPLAERWRARLPDTDFAAPDGPEPFSGGGDGRQWFDIAGVTPANRPARVAAARGAFNATVGSAILTHGLADRLDHVALVGFSQGTIMALDLVASGRLPVGAVVGFSGRLAAPPPLTPAAIPVLLVHGDADPVIPASESEAAAAALTALGTPVRTAILPGLGHTISATGADLGGTFLAEMLTAG